MAMENAKHAHGDTETAQLIVHGAASPSRHERVSCSLSALTLRYCYLVDAYAK